MSDASASGGAAYFENYRQVHQSTNSPHGLKVESWQPDLINPWVVDGFNSDDPLPSEKIHTLVWSAEQAELSSTWRELKTIENSLIAFTPQLISRDVLWLTDNLGGTRIIKKGSKKYLNSLALSINKLCEANNIRLEVKWVRRDLNKCTDKLSRLWIWMIGV